jgi:hypothetical protein
MKNIALGLVLALTMSLSVSSFAAVVSEKSSVFTEINDKDKGKKKKKCCASSEGKDKKCSTKEEKKEEAK